MNIVEALKTVRNGLAVYGAWCLVSGVAEEQVLRLADRVTDRLVGSLFGNETAERTVEEPKKEKKKPLIFDVEYEEVGN